MRSSITQIPIEIAELERLLNENPDSPLWKQKVTSKNVIGAFITELSILLFSVILYFDVLFIIYSLIAFIPIAYITFHATTTTYSIYPDHIQFEWGIFEKKTVNIPFNSISSIHLVTYNNSKKSTIYFGTTEKFKVQRINFDENDSRAHITFENVNDGEKVDSLLQLLWTRKNKSLKLKTMLAENIKKS